MESWAENVDIGLGPISVPQSSPVAIYFNIFRFTHIIIIGTYKFSGENADSSNPGGGEDDVVSIVNALFDV